MFLVGFVISHMLNPKPMAEGETIVCGSRQIYSDFFSSFPIISAPLIYLPNFDVQFFFSSFYVFSLLNSSILTAKELYLGGSSKYQELRIEHEWETTLQYGQNHVHLVIEPPYFQYDTQNKKCLVAIRYAERVKSQFFKVGYIFLRLLSQTQPQ